MIILLPAQVLFTRAKSDSSDSFFRFNIQIALSARLGERGSGGCGIKDIVSLATVNISATKEKGKGGGTTA